MRQVRVKAGLAGCCRSLTVTTGSCKRSPTAQKTCWIWIVVPAAGQDSGPSQIWCQSPGQAHRSAAQAAASHLHLSSRVPGLPNQSHSLLSLSRAAPSTLCLPSVSDLRRVGAVVWLSPPETRQTGG